MSDELAPLRDLFAISAFTPSLEGCKKLSSGPKTSGGLSGDLFQAELLAIEGRCYLATGKYSLLKDFKDHPEAGARTCALTAMFLRAKEPATQQKAFDALLDLAKTSKDPAAVYLAACCYMVKGEDDPNMLVEAVRLLESVTSENPSISQSAQFLSLTGLKGQALLGLHQQNLAVASMRECATANDESAVCKVLSALVNLVGGNSQEAFLLYCDIEAQFGEALENGGLSLSVLNGKAAANMQRGCWGEASEELERAVKAAPGDVDTLANLASLGCWKENGDEMEKWMAQLGKVQTDHWLVRKIGHLEASLRGFNGAA